MISSIIRQSTLRSTRSLQSSAVRSTRNYATVPPSGPTPGAHPPSHQGGSRVTGTRNMLIGSVIVLAGSTAIFLSYGGHDKKKEALGVSSVTAEGASKLESGSVARAKGNM